MMPTAKQTRHSVDGCSAVVAWRTMRKIDDARGTPKDSGRFVTKMKIVPLRFRVYEFAASDADVDDAGYSPPVPKPVTPRATVNIQNIPAMVVPWAAADKIRPRMTMPVVRTMATFLPK